MAGLAAAAIQLVEQPFVRPLSQVVEQRRWGLLKRFSLPVWMEVACAAALLDYGFSIRPRLDFPLGWFSSPD